MQNVCFFKFYITAVRWHLNTRWQSTQSSWNLLRFHSPTPFTFLVWLTLSLWHSLTHWRAVSKHRHMNTHMQTSINAGACMHTKMRSISIHFTLYNLACLPDFTSLQSKCSHERVQHALCSISQVNRNCTASAINNISLNCFFMDWKQQLSYAKTFPCLDLKGKSVFCEWNQS